MDIQYNLVDNAETPEILILRRQPNNKYCLLFKASQHGIERLEICDKEDDKNPKIITLENCVKITQEPPPANLIHVVTKSGTLTLNAVNDNDLKKWLNALQSVAFKDKGTLPRNSVIEEDNDLYCTSYSDGVFTIRLHSSDTSVKCNLEAKTYVLHLTTTELQLKSMDENNSIVAKWPYRYIRKYGYRDGKFTFEAGRKCDTGEGVFSLEHSNPQEIFRCMAAKMKSMKKLISGDSIGSLDCGEHQLNAALSMEAGSRSPLPPSPNHHSHSESELNQSGHLIRGFLSSNDSLNNVSTSSSSIPLIKHTPHKPPRKSLGIVDNENRTTKSQKHSKTLPISTETIKSGTIVLKTPPEPNKTLTPLIIPTTESSNEMPPKLPIRNESKPNDERDYESIETITNAWRTRGIDDIKHTERMTTPEDEIVEFAWQRSQSQVDSCDKRLVISSTIESDVNMIDDNYDRLEFFPAKTKTSSDYKTVVTINSAAVKPSTTANDYEIIGGLDISPCRLADDSYLGYGVLRKPASSLNTVSHDEVLGHHEYNGLDYAIVSKPKRV
ncbi:Docking protein 1 [Pseudolycoriella hygida]|uniref:Docking protein 1 n=1 Tax=Pseudolycoriella hygida TaxID=35572 RepID=A0A9Q0MS83_9DIPT|nr:Docking protein 1 [Pseudolycoriella hygida]